MIKAIARKILGAVPVTRVVRASSYDNAKTNNRNAEKWFGAKELSADAAASAEDRRHLRNRSRYVLANVSVAAGMVDTLANDVIGTGPRVQIRGLSGAAESQVEQEWTAWASSVDFGAMLRLMVKSLVGSGEVFSILATDPTLMAEGEIDLDIRIIEADQVANPYENPLEEASGEVDGIRFDPFGNPESYFVLRDHPGSERITGAFLEGDDVDARDMIHLYRLDRPGMSRGVPWMTPAIDRLLSLDGFARATLDAASAAATPSGVVYTDQSPEEAEEEPDERDILNLKPGEWLTLFRGWKIGQMKSEHPTTTFPQFRAEIIKDAARCLNMPYNVAAGDSSSYNYASGRLDHQVYYRFIRVIRSTVERVVLARVFARWVERAALIEGKLPQSMRKGGVKYRLEWRWDGNEHVDPLKEANAEAVRLRSGTITFADVFARQGRDWETQFEQLKKERDRLAKLGIGLDSVVVEEQPEDADA